MSVLSISLTASGCSAAAGCILLSPASSLTLPDAAVLRSPAAEDHLRTRTRTPARRSTAPTTHAALLRQRPRPRPTDARPLHAPAVRYPRRQARQGPTWPRFWDPSAAVPGPHEAQILGLVVSGRGCPPTPTHHPPTKVRPPHPPTHLPTYKPFYRFAHRSWGGNFFPPGAGETRTIEFSVGT